MDGGMIWGWWSSKALQRQWNCSGDIHDKVNWPWEGLREEYSRNSYCGCPKAGKRMRCSGRERPKGQEENNGGRGWRYGQGWVPGDLGTMGRLWLSLPPLSDPSLHSHYTIASLLSESVCHLGSLLTEPLDGFLNFKVSGNCLKALICAPQKYFHDMNKMVKTEITSGPSLNPKFQMPGILEEGLQGKCPPGTLPITPTDRTGS